MEEEQKILSVMDMFQDEIEKVKAIEEEKKKASSTASLFLKDTSATNNTVRLTLRLEKETHAKITNLAKKDVMTMNAYINLILKKYVKEIEDQQE